uniref:Uncharacterized protein n=1 Tax=viral metagenome TaxID=1070528 RepID=A0A6C0L1I8_9ZZZZ|tara:strand:+ start:6398 stop:6760 length:363 start_codon:yes stop_codon:yes gene_type:complete
MNNPEPMSTSSNMMNYKVAIKSTLKSNSTPENSNPDSKQSHEEYLQLIESAEFQKRANIQMNKIVKRFLDYKRQELRLENYDEEEIDHIIEKMLTFENDGYDDYLSDEDNDSVFSDEGSF